MDIKMTGKLQIDESPIWLGATHGIAAHWHPDNEEYHNTPFVLRCLEPTAYAAKMAGASWLDMSICLTEDEARELHHELSIILALAESEHNSK